MAHDLQELKKLALIAMVSDDRLMELLVLKGGNLIDLVYKVAFRSSLDLDFSIENDFEPHELASLKDTIDRTLKTTYAEHGYQAFDISFQERPKHLSEDMRDFWGGYRIEFKLISDPDYQELRSDPAALRRNAEIGRASCRERV